MAQVTIEVPDNQVNRIKDAFKSFYNYNPNTDGPENAFIKKKLIDFVRETVKSAEINAAAETARTGYVDPGVT